MTNTKPAYRFTFQGRNMPHAVPRFLSSLTLAVKAEESLRKMGCRTTPIQRVTIRRTRSYDNARFGMIDKMNGFTAAVLDGIVPRG